MVAVSSNLPVASTTATFTPVRMPGSSPIATCGPAGAASSRSRRLSPKTLMATFSASSRRRANKSRSKPIESLTFQVQMMDLRIRSSDGRAAWRQPRCRAMRASANEMTGALAAAAFSSATDLVAACAYSASGTANFASKNSSARPLKTAKARCEGTRPIGSS